ncbi:alpha/beta hydrolase [Argonema antarcticum]|uniref:alpha/beta hydrolase n=1 Tax=Argonema antarcticum TaxID=2942763 RepID=UPI002010CC99|nr:alpha/beta hydrolase [Argonema antarcticum]MCL1470001.1 alpha/beta hydrolase [Argonema antarcticum A004/B2]
MEIEIKREYEDELPFTWRSDAQKESDLSWLQEIIEDTGRFSDRWAKARIVQLAYELDSEEKIAERLQNELREEDKPQNDKPEQYRSFKEEVNVEYVINTLNQWKGKKFRQRSARNFEVFAYKNNPNVFLVISRTTSSFDLNHNLPPKEHFQALFNVNELARLIQDSKAKRLTLRTHGYATPSENFYKGFCKEADRLSEIAQNGHFYIGYSWPSEQPLPVFKTWQGLLRKLAVFSQQLDKKPLKKRDRQIDIRLKFIFFLALSAGIVGTLATALLMLAEKVFSLQLLTFLPQWVGISSVVFLLWGLAFWLLRQTGYQGDRTRAIYYGVPDLAEFFWRLDKGLSKFAPDCSLKVNMIGHSMGGLVILNTLRILCYQFRNDRQEKYKFGDRFTLDKLILASPDVPLELMRQGRSNYVRTALNCCDQIYLMSSDRDIVLRYLSNVGNWFTEPSIQMSGVRLGNVYLRNDSQGKIAPWVRAMFYSQPTLQITSDPQLFNKVNYLDCSQMGSKKGRGGVNGIRSALAKISLEKSQIDINLNGMFIDLGNAIRYVYDSTLYRLKKSELDGLDLHGGYFQQETLSFEILEFLLKTELEETDIQKQLEIAIGSSSEIRFLPSSKPVEQPANQLAASIR